MTNSMLNINEIALPAEHFFNINLPKTNKIELEIGCGKGTFTTQLGKKYPERTIIALDILLGRLRKLYKRNRRNNLNNIYLCKTEAWYFIGKLIPDNSIDRIHILCPDPWPKRKHRGQRLISSEFIGRIYRKLKENGILHISTDYTNYFSDIEESIVQTNLFLKNDAAIDDVIDMKTDFEVMWNDVGYNVVHSAWQKMNE